MMNVTYILILVSTGGIRESNRRDLVIKYCESLDTFLTILQETHVNFSYQHNFRNFRNGKMIILSRKTQIVLFKTSKENFLSYRINNNKPRIRLICPF